MMDDAELVRLLRELVAREVTAMPPRWEDAYNLYRDAADRIEALIAERDAALEEAARIAETLGVHPQLNVWGGGPDWFKHGKNIAAAIRAMKGKSQ